MPDSRDSQAVTDVEAMTAVYLLFIDGALVLTPFPTLHACERHVIRHGFGSLKCEVVRYARDLRTLTTLAIKPE